MKSFITFFFFFFCCFNAQSKSSSHPVFSLLDENGHAVLETQQPLSLEKTCQGCHDINYIRQNCSHSTVGSDEISQNYSPKGHSWDLGPGYFGRWDPISYRYLSPSKNFVDMGVADWIRLLGNRHVGGGPAFYSKWGGALTEQSKDTSSSESFVLDSASGKPLDWDWKKSGVVEMNCFLCHLSNPNNVERIKALRTGKFAQASTATLFGTSLIQIREEKWNWNPDAFEKNGNVKKDLLPILAPKIENCGLCHGQTHTGEKPLLMDRSMLHWETETKGQIFSSQRISLSGLNIAGKESLSRPWDIHAERLLKCSNCHYSLNNPSYFKESSKTKPEHLKYDARKLSLGEFLWTPSHQFAKGESASLQTANHLDRSMRTCSDCHNTTSHEKWLPYMKRHLDTLSCEACHIPKIYATARQETDWTFLSSTKEPRIVYYGVDSGEPFDPSTLINGYEPILLPRRDSDGQKRLYPHNLITSWYWITGEPPLPVRLFDLERALFDGEKYVSDLLLLFDQDKNGNIEKEEAQLDTSEKVEGVRKRLEQLGLKQLKIVGEIQPFSIHHSVAPMRMATKTCERCHSEDSILNRPFSLSVMAPGEVVPVCVGDTNVSLTGALERNGKGWSFYFSTTAAGYYLIGKDRWSSGDQWGFTIFISVFVLVCVHSLLRIFFIKWKK